MVKNRVKELVDAKGWNVSAFANAAGVSFTTANMIYKGQAERFGLTTINALCAALNCKPGDLFEYEPDKDTVAK